MIHVGPKGDQLRQLIALPSETECVEFKVNNAAPEKIGEYISALANSAALVGASFGYIIWGVTDNGHTVVGTTFDATTQKVGNEPLVSWLASQVRPSVNFQFHESSIDDHRIVYAEITAASHTPVRFKDFEYIRVGHTTRKLRDHPEKERALWRLFAGSSFETQDAKVFDSVAEALSTLDLEAYFRLTKTPRMQIDRLAELLMREGFLRSVRKTQCSVTNLGALLLATDLKAFPNLARRASRVIFYEGTNRAVAKFEQEGQKGYAAGFAGLVTFIDERLPRREQIGPALREQSPMYPTVAIRELVANALIHQEVGQPGTGPMVEIFEDRIEITNPGIPLVDTLRIIDAPPRSRNEQMATFMRRARICEERGSGIDRVIGACEAHQLPPPQFMVVEGFTRATLYAPRPLKNMSREDRMRACYQHAVLHWLSDSQMTNASLRTRLGIKAGSAAQASRIIKETLEENLIKPFDPMNESPRHNKYVPFWA